jgi:hypothetical protein
MGWFDKHKPDATKTAEEQSKAEMDALLERFTAAVDEKVAPLRETVTKLQTDWDTIKTEATRPPVTDTTPKNPDGTPRELTAEEQQRNLNAALLQSNIQTAARLTEREVLDALPADWQHLVPEIRAHFNNTPIQRKAQADYAEYCNNCADLVIAKAARKAGLRYNRDNQTFFLEDKSTSTTREDGVLSDPSLSWRQETANGTRVWTPEEQLAKLGIDPQKFSESVKKGVV